MADVVKTPFDVALQHPLRGEAAAEGRENAFTGVLRTASLAEAEGLCVRRRLRYRVKGQSVERLMALSYMQGMPSGRFAFLPFFSMNTRRSGLA